MIRFSLLLTPFAVVRTKVSESVGLFTTAWAGFVSIYIFGFRIAKIQVTNPWD